MKSGQPAYSPGRRVMAAAQDFHPMAAYKATPGEPSFGASLEAFVAACKSRDRTIAPGIATGYEVLKVIDMAYRSSDAGGSPVAA